MPSGEDRPPVPGNGLNPAGAVSLPDDDPAAGFHAVGPASRLPPDSRRGGRGPVFRMGGEQHCQRRVQPGTGLSGPVVAVDEHLEGVRRVQAPPGAGLGEDHAQGAALARVCADNPVLPGGSRLDLDLPGGLVLDLPGEVADLPGNRQVSGVSDIQGLVVGDRGC